MAKTIVVTIHGQECVGLNMEKLARKLDAEAFMDDVVFINIRYTRLPTMVNTLPWVRTMTAKYVAARLNGICNKYPVSRLIVIAHSNGTRATRIAMDANINPKKKWPTFWIDNLILLGCPIKQNYRWDNHVLTQVVNFVSVNDKVVWLARFYGMGSAGRFGFKHISKNLRQVFVKWGHSGFMKQYPLISEIMRGIMNKGGML